MSSRRPTSSPRRLRLAKAHAPLTRWLAGLSPGTTGTALELALLHPAPDPSPEWAHGRAVQIGNALRRLEGHGTARAAGIGRSGIPVWTVGGGPGLPWA